MALVWPNKDPGETEDFDLDWTLRLAGDTILTSSWAFTETDSPAAGTLIMGSPAPADSHTTTRSKVWLSAGNLGQSYALQNTITTAAGETMVETVLLVIRAK